jgi:putative redox protein
MNASATLVGGMAFRGKADSGHELTLDSAPEVGGEDKGLRPMELLILGLAGCTGMDVISILRKMRQEVTGYEVRVAGERADEHPKVYTHIAVEHVVRGRGLSPQNVARAVELSATRYCPASAMLGKAARVEHTFRIVEEDGEA